MLTEINAAWERKLKEMNKEKSMPKINDLSGIGAAIKRRNVKEAEVLLQSGRFVDCANLLDGIDTSELLRHPNSHNFAFSFYRRAIRHQCSDNHDQAVNDLEVAKKFPNLPESLKKLFQSRQTAILRRQAPEILDFNTLIYNQFNVDDPNLLSEFSRKYRLQQPRCKLHIPNIYNYSCVGIYRWVGDINKLEMLSQLIRKCKAGEQETLPLLACLMAEHIFSSPDLRNWLAEIDYLVPVPFSQIHAASRGVQITTILTKQLGRRLRIPCVHDFLRRQGNDIRARDATLKQIEAQYTFNERMRSVAKGRVILLIDDVVATGRTANICARRLKELGCKRVFLLVVAQSESTIKSQG